jgi:hypothetical protein
MNPAYKQPLYRPGGETGFPSPPLGVGAVGSASADATSGRRVSHGAMDGISCSKLPTEGDHVSSRRE